MKAFNFLKLQSLSGLLSLTVCLMAVSAHAVDETYVVQDGDTLSSIASQQYGDSGRWVEILNANRERIQENGSLIVAGTSIVLPDLEELEETRQQLRVQATQAIDPRGLSQPLPVDDYGTVTLVTGNDYPPFTDQSLDQGGMLTEIVRTALLEANLNLDITFEGWSEGFDKAQAGRFQGTFPWFFNDERDKRFFYSKPLFDVLILAFVREESELRYQDQDDLIGLRLCRPDGYFTHDIDSLVAENLITHVAPVEVADCFQMLIDGEVDLVSINELTGNATIIQNGWQEQVIASDQAMAVQSLHAIFPKSTRNGRTLTYRFDQALATLSEDGRLNEIISRHIEAYYANL